MRNAFLPTTLMNPYFWCYERWAKKKPVHSGYAGATFCVIALVGLAWQPINAGAGRKNG